MKSSEPNLRIPAVLMPSYLKAVGTDEGKKAEKRVRVNCGICKETRYYSIYRGVTKIVGSILACEACRHSYQKFKRRPCILKCSNGGGCYILGDNSKTRCKACWIAHILRLCPLPKELYIHLVKHLPDPIKEKMGDTPPVIEDIPEDDRGALGLEMQNTDDEWEDITELATPQEEEEEEEEEEAKEEEEEEKRVEEVANGEQQMEEEMDDATLDAYFEAEQNLAQVQTINNGNIISTANIISNAGIINNASIINNPGILNNASIINSQGILNNASIINSQGIINNASIINNAGILNNASIINNAGILNNASIVNNANQIPTFVTVDSEGRIISIPQMPNVSTVKTEPSVEVSTPQAVKVWAGTEGITYSIVPTNTQSYFNMSNMSASDGLTPLTPVQPVDGNSGLTALTPMTPVVDIQGHHTQLNGNLHTLMPGQIFTIKQECITDGESQEAGLFQNISVKNHLLPDAAQDSLLDLPLTITQPKKEYHILPAAPPQDPTMDLAASPYFTQPCDSRISINILDSPHSTTEVPLDAVEYEAASPMDVKQEVVKPKKKYKKKKKIKTEEDSPTTLSNILAEATKRAAIDEDDLEEPCPKQKRKIDRFDGVPEEEVAKRGLPDHLGPNMDILIIGINPGLFAAHKGHHYAGPGNHFWKCMYLSGLIPEPFTAYDDFRLLDYGIGFTNIVARTTRGSADLTKQEIKQGAEILLEKLRQYQPLIAVFNGKGIYEIFSGKKKFHFGKQPDMVEGTNTHIWVQPSSSARCAQLPRALDKVPFYTALRRYRDFLKGLDPEVDESEFTFANVKLTNVKSPIKQEPKIEYDDFGEPKKSFTKALEMEQDDIPGMMTIKSEIPS